MNTHNIRFLREIGKYISDTPLIWSYGVTLYPDKLKLHKYSLVYVLIEILPQKHLGLESAEILEIVH